MQDMTYAQAVKEAESFLADHGIADASVDAWLLFSYVTGIGRAMFLAERMNRMEKEQYQRYQELLAKRALHIPLQHLTGEQEFMGFSFLVNNHVLVPRQDTETLVEMALSYVKPGMRLLDLCTGSGCIAISLARLCPGLVVDAADISKEALAVAMQNATRLEAEVTFWQGDLFACRKMCKQEVQGKDLQALLEKQPDENVRKEEEQEKSPAIAGECEAAKRSCEDDEMQLQDNLPVAAYDCIVSNPPYIRTAVIGTLSEEVRCHEPYQALDGREDGLYFYRRIVSKARSYLKKDGHIFFEIGYDQGEAVKALLENAGYTQVTVTKDLAGLDRVVSGKA